MQKWGKGEDSFDTNESVSQAYFRGLNMQLLSYCTPPTQSPILSRTGATGYGQYRHRFDAETFLLFYIACNGTENELSECDLPNGPEAGVLWGGKYWCSWSTQVTAVSWNYNVAVINCSKCGNAYLLTYIAT